MGQVLNSWQEIAAYVGKGLRTVQRWEREIDFPVHRTGKEGCKVIGYTDEINDWMHRSQPAVVATTVVQDRLARSRTELARLRCEVERAREQIIILCSRLTDLTTRRSQVNSGCRLVLHKHCSR